ncbi:ATP-binding protein [Pseudomonas sp. A-RE-19]|uniref:sensor histidine kinase n=1 Tax=Pseudomonas sp. A-RE-19 TaxID=2832401 RepID=UPI001CBD501C|nr:ATP-binding protein [Pseudomonas sp. A-RE-19]
MRTGDKLFGRLLNRPSPQPPIAPDAPSVHSVGVQMHLDGEGRVIHLTGPLRHLLAQQMPGAQPPRLLDYLMPHSVLSVEGTPAEWQGQSLDLDFFSLGEQPLHLRGWVQPLGDNWLLQLIDIGDLLLERRQARSREQCQLLAAQVSEPLRLCSLTRLPEVLADQLQGLALRFQIPCMAIALLDEQAEGWLIHQNYTAFDAPRLWDINQRLGTGLDSLNGSAPQPLTPSEYPRLQSIFGNAEGFAVPYHNAQGVVAWLLCGFYPVQQRAPDLSERDWLQLTAALAGPLLERLREHQHHLQLERLESLQALLGEMATGLAHEINQPLNAMRMAIVNVLKRLSNGDAQIDYLTDKLNCIDAQVQRAARAVDHMRVFGRRSEVEQHPFNPAQAIEGTLSLLSEGMRGRGVELRVSETGFEVQVRGYVDQLEQVLINLMVNARDALLNKREADPAFKPWISVYAERDEHTVRLWIEDNGGGIDPRLLERIFEPFFTTKPVGVGTGLGLSVSYGIVENMGGKLSVGNSSEGARFCIELPIVTGDQITHVGHPE